MHTKDRVDFMIFPRLCALAESAWSAPTVKDYDKFLSRMEDAFTLFDKLNIYYFDYRNPQHHPEPAGPVIKKKEKYKWISVTKKEMLHEDSYLLFNNCTVEHQYGGKSQIASTT